MAKLKTPPRQPNDGPVKVRRAGANLDVIELCVEHPNCIEVIRVSEHNAWRLFGLLGFMLGIPLTKEAGKAIKL
jgi:hypothetical protein